MPAVVSGDFVKMVEGYGITTAKILYWMPDHKHILQTYVWQELDLHPRFPKLTGFLEFWENNLEGKLHRVKVAHARLIKPAEFKMVNHQLHLH
jgi:uncharacterized protein Usg